MKLRNHRSNGSLLLFLRGYFNASAAGECHLFLTRRPCILSNLKPAEGHVVRGIHLTGERAKSGGRSALFRIDFSSILLLIF